jgi:hypothetical protein
MRRHSDKRHTIASTAHEFQVARARVARAVATLPEQCFRKPTFPNPVDAVANIAHKGSYTSQTTLLPRLRRTISTKKGKEHNG